MTGNKKKVLAILLSSMLLCACSADDGIKKIEDAFGLGMGSGDAENVVAETKTEDIVIEEIEEKEETSDNKDEEKEEAEPADEETEETVAIYDEVNKRYSKDVKNHGEITLSFAGDVSLYDGGSVLARTKSNDNGMAGCFDEAVLKRMMDSDIFMLNNEFPYSSKGSPLPNKMYTFRSAPENVKYLYDIGTDIVSLANNHTYDYGPTALEDCVDILNDAKMPFVGAGKNIEEAMKPAYFYMDGKVIAIVAATQIEGFGNPETKEATENSPGVLRCLDTTKIKQVIKEADENADFVICFIHWGREKCDLIMDWQRTEAKDMVEAGADFIVGAHAHCLQGIDYVDGVPVCYGMGNYLFNKNTQDTCLITLTLDSSSKDSVGIKSVQFMPCIMTGAGVRSATDEEWARIIKYEQGISNHALLDEKGFVTYSEEDKNTQHGANTSPMRGTGAKEEKSEEAAEGTGEGTNE